MQPYWWPCCWLICKMLSHLQVATQLKFCLKGGIANKLLPTIKCKIGPLGCWTKYIMDSILMQKLSYLHKSLNQKRDIIVRPFSSQSFRFIALVFMVFLYSVAFHSNHEEFCIPCAMMTIELPNIVTIIIFGGVKLCDNTSNTESSITETLQSASKGGFWGLCRETLGYI